jgi:hypothetical protein
MGYKSGQGLGRQNQGLINPIEARLLPKGNSLIYPNFFNRFSLFQYRKIFGCCT